MQKLKYLWTATYRDGFVYQQTPEDVSLTNPKKSCFFDIVKQEMLENDLQTILDFKEAGGELNEDQVRQLAELPALIEEAKSERNQRDLASFVLKGEAHEYGIDLRDGHFEVDGVPFFMHTNPVKRMIDSTGKEKIASVPFTHFKLIFFRQHTHEVETKINIKKQIMESQKEISHTVVYGMGFQPFLGDEKYPPVIMRFA